MIDDRAMLLGRAGRTCGGSSAGYMGASHDDVAMSALRPDGRPRAPRRRRCAACAMRTRAGRTLPDDPPVDGWDVIRMRKLLLQPSSSSAGDAGVQDAIGEAIHEAGGDLGDAAS